MSASLITAALALPLDLDDPLGHHPLPDFDAARTALAAVDDPAAFRFDQVTSIEEDIEEILPDLPEDTTLRDENGIVLLDLARRVGEKIIDQLQEEFESQTTDVMRIGGYRVFLTGELTYGDLPEGVRAFASADRLPDSVLTAMGVVRDFLLPPGRTA